MAFYTYILHCRDGSYYVGHTDDIERRIAEHQTDALGGYTARRLPVALLWAESFQTRDDAFAAERKLKGWSRAKKEAMMAETGRWSANWRDAGMGAEWEPRAAGGLRQAQAERGW